MTNQSGADSLPRMRPWSAASVIESYGRAPWAEIGSTGRTCAALVVAPAAVPFQPAARRRRRRSTRLGNALHGEGRDAGKGGGTSHYTSNVHFLGWTPQAGGFTRSSTRRTACSALLAVVSTGIPDGTPARRRTRRVVRGCVRRPSGRIGCQEIVTRSTYLGYHLTGGGSRSRFRSVVICLLFVGLFSAVCQLFARISSPHPFTTVEGKRCHRVLGCVGG